MIRAPSAESAFHGVDAHAKGGITGIEIIFSIPDAPDIIDLLRQRFGDSVLIGAGSIVQPSQAIEAAQAGASFLVSPGVSEPVARAIIETGLTPCPAR